MNSLSLIPEDDLEVSVVKFIDMDDDNSNSEEEHGVTNVQLVEIAHLIDMESLRERHCKIIDSFPIEAVKYPEEDYEIRLLRYISDARSLDLTGKLYCDIIYALHPCGSHIDIWCCICAILCRLFVAHIENNPNFPVTLDDISVWWKRVSYQYYDYYCYMPWRESLMSLEFLANRIYNALPAEELKNVNNKDVILGKLQIVTHEPESVGKLDEMTKQDLENALANHLFDDKPISNVLPDYPPNGIGFDKSLVTSVIERLLVVNEMTHERPSAQLLFIMKLIRRFHKKRITKISQIHTGNLRVWMNEHIWASESESERGIFNLKGWYWNHQIVAAEKKYNKVFLDYLN